MMKYHLYVLSSWIGRERKGKVMEFFSRRRRGCVIDQVQNSLRMECLSDEKYIKTPPKALTT
jgi:hypothetical protein